VSKGRIVSLLKNEPQLSFIHSFIHYYSGKSFQYQMICNIRDGSSSFFQYYKDTILFNSSKIGDFGIAKLLENKLGIFRFSLKLNKLYDGTHYVTQPNRIKKQAVLANKLI
jgi:hypothetical protein